MFSNAIWPTRNVAYSQQATESQFDDRPSRLRFAPTLDSRAETLLHSGRVWLSGTSRVLTVCGWVGSLTVPLTTFHTASAHLHDNFTHNAKDDANKDSPTCSQITKSLAVWVATLCLAQTLAFTSSLFLDSTRVPSACLCRACGLHGREHSNHLHLADRIH